MIHLLMVQETYEKSPKLETLENNPLKKLKHDHHFKKCEK